MINNFSKYDFFYTNGSSFTFAGGLEEPSVRPDSSMLKYQEKYGVTWKNREEVNWAARLSQIINLPVINESACGGGPDRGIRMAYDFIQKNWDKKDKFFIILENPDSTRCDVFYKPLNSYFILNTEMKQEKMLYATRDYWGIDNKLDDANLQPIFQKWTENHYSLNNKIAQDEKSLIGFYSFCKLNNIKLFLMRNNWLLFTDLINREDFVNFNSENDDVYNWCKKNHLTIYDEIGVFGNNIVDYHPGFFGHIEYAKKMAYFLNWRGEFPNFPDINEFKKNNYE